MRYYSAFKSMAAMVKRLSHGLVVPALRVRFPLAAPAKNPLRKQGFFAGMVSEDEKPFGSMLEVSERIDKVKLDLSRANKSNMAESHIPVSRPSKKSLRMQGFFVLLIV